MYKAAVNHAPSIIIFEDIDRAFPKTGEVRSNISLQTLLNCLDGIKDTNGLITLATANDPQILDKSILQRPGRFDRTVFFDNPNDILRRRYFLKKNPSLQDYDFSDLLVSTEGCSFAQLQEIFILGGQLAYEANTEVISGDLLLEASYHLSGDAQKLKKSKAIRVGF
jgi:SpoVK/Ycf46/Vps4 family AAA+-type ATPase